MSLDPLRVTEVQSWFLKAANDLRGAKVDLTVEPPLLEDALFHCQQAVEKPLKAFLVWHSVPFRKTHSLEEIGSQCEEMDPTLKPLVDRVVYLSAYAWEFRYPGPTSQPTREGAEEASALAREAVETILQRLPPEVRP